ncbi:hypothetical protein GCM10022409_47410 [Hymenobacter glaciei]|uniref:Outer membrane protein beta-barrel domain-containing protein n=1 Tax=Hymenobacter glaciei TaxID=877209 RepID=A0ABP7UX05_9BACT
MHKKNLVLAWAALLWPLPAVHAQEAAGKGGSIQAAVGVGAQEGNEEGGLGVVYALGYLKSWGAAARWRFNPQIVCGEFSSAGFTDRQDQFYRTTSAGVAVHYDVLRYRAVAVVVSGGGSASYARGLLGTGGEQQLPTEGSRYFHRLYFSANGGVGLRVSPTQGRLAYEFRPLTLQVGTKGFFMGYATVGLEVKLHR